MTPQTFIQKWGPGGPAFHLNEEQGAQSHFIDLCELLGVPKPGSEAGYVFEEKNAMVGGRTGYADVFRRGAFAWENKAPGKNLEAALRQLQSYSLALSNPPILVVCDRLSMRIYTQFSGHPTETHIVLLAELDQPDKQALLRRIWLEPESFRPKKTSRDITEAAARSFATLADSLRKRGPAKEADATGFQTHADEVAHFLTQCLFCFFAEDVGLLPGRMFEGLVNNRKLTSDKLTTGLHNLFTVMQGGGLYGNDDIPRFNGGLFQKIKVPQLTVLEMTELRNAAALNWSAIDVSIFGTLFERGLDPAKRSQLGAHYTDPATIMRIVEPVLKRPLLQIWEQTAHAIQGLMAKNTRKGDKHYKAAQARFIGWLDQLKTYRVLDPACGSGNFLFLGLKALKDIEHQSHLEAAALGLDREADLVTGPHNMLGIELNEYAAELARVTVWIGELQWRLQHGYEFKTNPVLEPLDHIECRDALLTWAPKEISDASTVRAEPVEASWPKASVVIGNPPFLGGSKKRGELGGDYFEALKTVYAASVPGFGDLVCYWFAKALKAIEINGLGAAGLVSTNSIRGGANRKVLDAICERSEIFEAWSDEAWINDGAAVRVSLVCFGHAGGARLDGASVGSIHPDLTEAGADGLTANLTTAVPLPESSGACCYGSQEKGSFDLNSSIAESMLRLPNPHGVSNAKVIKRSVNARQVAQRRNDSWVIDFGLNMPEQDAALFEGPFHYVRNVVRPERLSRPDKGQAKRWWLHARPSPVYRNFLASYSKRVLVSPAVAKHRTFSWLETCELADHALIVVTRADDTTFGILHSRFHELWSLRMGTSLEDRPALHPHHLLRNLPLPRRPHARRHRAPEDRSGSRRRIDSGWSFRVKSASSP